MRRLFQLRELYGVMRALTLVFVALGIVACGERSEAQNDAEIRAALTRARTRPVPRSSRSWRRRRWAIASPATRPEGSP